MTHPFHPWHGREFVFIAVRRTWGEDRVFFFGDDGQVSLPRGWTDAGDVDAFVAIADGRSALRVADLVVLAEVIDGLALGAINPCKRDSAGPVKGIVPEGKVNEAGGGHEKY